MPQLTLLSHAEVKVGFFITEVIGDFPEPEARKFFQELMSNNREVTDKEWATIFEVHREQFSYLSIDLVQLLLELVPSAALQVCLTCHLIWCSFCWSNCFCCIAGV